MLPNPVATRCGRRRIVTYKCTELGWQLMYIYNLGSKEIKHVFAEQFAKTLFPIRNSTNEALAQSGEMRKPERPSEGAEIRTYMRDRQSSS